jgi:hypothetical protein
MPVSYLAKNYTSHCHAMPSALYGIYMLKHSLFVFRHIIYMLQLALRDDGRIGDAASSGRPSGENGSSFKANLHFTP